MQGVATYSAALIEQNLAAGRGAKPAFVDDCGVPSDPRPPGSRQKAWYPPLGARA
jgi:hypothetical protein